LLRADGSEKPAYHALKNLIDILEDQGPRFAPGSLVYTLRGDVAGIRQLLLQRRDGRFYLALWQTGTIFDLGTKRDMSAAPRALTLTLPQPAEMIELFEPLASAGPIASFARTATVKVPVPDHLVLVAITP
jgi:hypothetical protein